LNLDLTETIRDQFERNTVRQYELYIYLLLISGTLILAFAVLEFIYFIGLVIVSIVIGSSITKLKPMKTKSQYELDWVISPVECKEGDLVEITVVNVSEKNKDFFIETPVAWRITDQDNNPIFDQIIPSPINIMQYHSYRWFWDTKGVDPGFYRIFPSGKDYYLKKTIKITK